MGKLTCVACGKSRSEGWFSRRQLRKGPHRARCMNCEEESIPADWVIVRDDGCEAEFPTAAFSNPREGGFRRAIEGRYTSGELQGHTAIAKWPKKGNAYSSDVYNDDLRCAHYALDFVRAFNELNIAPVSLRVIIPSMHVFGRSSPYPGLIYLREPKVNKFTNWNVNGGWNVTNTPFARAMQAFTHFTYHASGGECIVCDIQGGLYEDQAILTDLAIISHRPWAFGSTDTGAKGMVKFFSKHVCNEFCNPEWDIPVQLAQDGSIINRPNPYKQRRIQRQQAQPQEIDLEQPDTQEDVDEYVSEEQNDSDIDADGSDENEYEVDERDELHEFERDSEVEVEESHAEIDEQDEYEESDIQVDEGDESHQAEVELSEEQEVSEIEDSDELEESDENQEDQQEIEGEEEEEEEEEGSHESEYEQSEQESYLSEDDDEFELDEINSVEIELSDSDDDRLSISSQSTDSEPEHDYYSSVTEEELSSSSSNDVSNEKIPTARIK